MVAAAGIKVCEALCVWHCAINQFDEMIVALATLRLVCNHLDPLRWLNAVVGRY